ncbi:MAG: FtsW/RodA/SpoVE family cell cycle protein [Clostridia bacterium]|nr:FtsW/RodA/SpoVE family cell cycle protein [Clostridia bacterium]
MEFLNGFTSGLSDFIAQNNDIGIIYTAIARWVFVAIAVFVVVRAIRSLLITKNPSEVWAYVQIDGIENYPLTHWENLIGRHKHCDIQINDSQVSRSHGTLTRNSSGKWIFKDLNSANGSFINGKLVTEPKEVKPGDTLLVGQSKITLMPISLEEQRNNMEFRKQDTKPMSPWPSLLAITIFQLLDVIQLNIALGDEFTPWVVVAFGLLCAVMWVYVLFLKGMQRRGFEMETLAFFLTTIGLSTTASANPDAAIKLAIAAVLGIVLMVFVCIVLRNLQFMKNIRKILVIVAAGLLLANLVFGTVQYGAANWIYIGGISIQPSELVKVVFIIIGAASLDELFEMKNLTLFIAFSVICLGCLAVMGDFGTAAIFFATFVVMAFLREGDFSKLILIVSLAVAGGLLALRFKEHIAQRFGVWRHVWEDVDNLGYQQTRTMSASASGGLIGVGAGNGWLKEIFAADTDLVFGMISEEWGLIIALLAVTAIISFALFSVMSIMSGRSAYYTIAACGATTMLVVQTMLNVFGSLDILPLTGVTFPFVSNGGTSMIAAWGLLGFLKAADTRQNASIAVSLAAKKRGGRVDG